MCPWQLTFVGLLVLGASSLQSTSQRTHSTDQSFATASEQLASLATWQHRLSSHMPQDARFWESIGKSAECPLQSVGLGTGSEMVDSSFETGRTADNQCFWFLGIKVQKQK